MQVLIEMMYPNNNTIESVCIGCTNFCGVKYQVENGKIAKLEGMQEHHVNRGALCARAYGMKQLVYAPNRIKTPLKRVGEKGEGKWKSISWDEALGIIANKLNEIKEKFGAEKVAFHRGRIFGGDDQREFFLRFANVFGSPNIAGPPHICYQPRSWAHCLNFGWNIRDVIPDFENTECILVWGWNPAHSAIPAAKSIFDAKDRGANLIVIDPRFNPIARVADKYLKIRPGTDGALALSMINVIIEENLYDENFVDKWTVGFDELKELVKKYPPEEVEKITWIPADTIREISRELASAKSACICPGVAFDHFTNSVQSARAMYHLIALTGNIDVPGGHILKTTWKDVTFQHDTIFTLREKVPQETIEKTLGIDKYRLIRKLKSPCADIMDGHSPSIYESMRTGKPYPIKAIVIWHSSPVDTESNTKRIIEALKEAELVVVIDPWMSSTAKYADIILPASTYLEWDWFNLSPERILLRRKVIEPLYASWPDIKIICELGRKMGYESYFPWKTIEEVMDERLRACGVTYDQLLKSQNNIIQMPVPAMTYKKYEKEGFNTPSKKVEFHSSTLAKNGYNPLPDYVEPMESPVSEPDLAKEYPLILITGAQLNLFTHSMHHNVPLMNDLMPENLLEINQETAEKLGITDGERVQVESPRGSITIKTKLTNGIHDRVVHMHHGFQDVNVNILIDNISRSPIIGSTGIKGSLCRVTKIKEF
jgi:anaerobic selenocysteine-containing dehydrogenase